MSVNDHSSSGVGPGRDAARGFLDRALDQTPSLVVGFVGAFLGIAIAVIAVLKLGGLDAPVNRIVNAYAAGVEASITKLEKSAGDIEGTTAKLQAVYLNLEASARRIDRLDFTTSSHAQKLLEHEGRITATEERVRRLRGVQ